MCKVIVLLIKPELLLFCRSRCRCRRLRLNSLSPAYLCWSIRIIRSFVKLPYDSVRTIPDLKLCHPFWKSVSTSLSRDTCYFGVTTKVHLKPLVKIICSSCPASYIPPWLFRIQPCLFCRIVTSPVLGIMRRCTYLSIRNLPAFHSKRIFIFQAKNVSNKEKKCEKVRM